MVPSAAPFGGPSGAGTENCTGQSSGLKSAIIAKLAPHSSMDRADLKVSEQRSEHKDPTYRGHGHFDTGGIKTLFNKPPDAP